MASVQEMLATKGIHPSPPGKKEGKKAGGVTVIQPPLVKKFAFAPRRLVQPVLTLQSKEELREQFGNLETYRKEIGPVIFDWVTRRRAFSTGTPDELILAKDDVDAIWASINSELNQEHSLGRQAAMFAFADALIQTCSADFPDDAKDALKDLVGVNFLKQVADGEGERIFGHDFCLAEEFAKNSEAKAIGRKLSQLVNRIAVAYKKRYQEDLAAMKTAVGDLPISVADLKLGKDGRILLPTPDHEYRDRNGKDHTYRGGFLLLESVGGKITIINGVGGCQHIAQKLAEAGAFIWNIQLSSERLELKERLSEEAFLNVRILHGLIYRGVTTAEKARERVEAADQRKADFKEQTAAERETLKALATLTSVEAFLFERSGMTVLDPLGRMPFEIRSQRNGEKPTLVWDVVALVEFMERDGRRYVRVADCPERLNGFFANFREFVPAGEKFSAVKWPFGVLLRMGYAAVLAEATPEQKSAIQAEVAQAEAARKAAEAQANLDLAKQLADDTGETLDGVSIPDPTEGRS